MARELRSEALRAVRIGEIGGEADALSPIRRVFSRPRVVGQLYSRRVTLVERAPDDVRLHAAADEPARDHQTDAAGPARDERDLAPDSEQAHRSLPVSPADHGRLDTEARARWQAMRKKLFRLDKPLRPIGT